MSTSLIYKIKKIAFVGHILGPRVKDYTYGPNFSNMNLIDFAVVYLYSHIHANIAFIDIQGDLQSIFAFLFSI